MELFNKVSAFAKSAAKDLTGATKSLGDVANDTIETAKLNAKLIPEKKGLDAQLKKIGEYYYEKHKNGEELEEGVAEFCAGADAYQKRIEELEKLIAEIEEAKKLREEQKVVAEAEAKVVESEEEAEAQAEENLTSGQSAEKNSTASRSGKIWKMPKRQKKQHPFWPV